jgi:hypothetical protein
MARMTDEEADALFGVEHPEWGLEQFDITLQTDLDGVLVNMKNFFMQSGHIYRRSFPP